MLAGCIYSGARRLYTRQLASSSFWWALGELWCWPPHSSFERLGAVEDRQDHPCAFEGGDRLRIFLMLCLGVRTELQARLGELAANRHCCPESCFAPAAVWTQGVRTETIYPGCFLRGALHSLVVAAVAQDRARPRALLGGPLTWSRCTSFATPHSSLCSCHVVG